MVNTWAVCTTPAGAVEGSGLSRHVLDIDVGTGGCGLGSQHADFACNAQRSGIVVHGVRTCMAMWSMAD